jgi:hypothetical protein
MMVIQKMKRVKGLRNLAVLGIILLGFMAVVGSSSDDAKDVAKDVVDIDFEEDATITLPAVTADKNFRVAGAVSDNCGTTSVKDEINKIEDDIEDLDLIDIDSVKLRYITVSYLAQWVPDSIKTLTCKMSISGDQNTSIAEMAINNPSGSSTLELTDEQLSVINYYLSNRAKEFTYCVECDNDELITDYTVSYTAELGVTIKGEF